MCTIAIWIDPRADVPVALAANRDEFYERPARAPFAFAPDRVGGRDDVLGGSWLAFGRDGRFAAVTNQHAPRAGASAPSASGHGPVAPEPGAGRAPRSRGELVLGLLDAGDRAAMRAYLDAIDPTAYASANLVFGDAGGVDLVYLRRAGTRERLALPPGLTVLANDRLDAPGQPKRARLHDHLAAAATWDDFARIAPRALADHAFADRPLDALCIHTPRYGTRSATVAALAPGRVHALAWADGPPCTTPFRDALPLFA